MQEEKNIWKDVVRDSIGENGERRESHISFYREIEDR